MNDRVRPDDPEPYPADGALTARLRWLASAFARCGGRPRWQALSGWLADCHGELAELRRTGSGIYHPDGARERGAAAREAEPVYEQAASAKHRASERLLAGPRGHVATVDVVAGSGAWYHENTLCTPAGRNPALTRIDEPPEAGRLTLRQAVSAGHRLVYLDSPGWYPELPYEAPTPWRLTRLDW